MATTIQTVTTEDSSPNVAPHRIGSNPATDDVAVLWTTAAGTIRAWRVVFNGNRKTGRRIASLGAVCGIDRVGAPGVMPLAEAGGIQRTTSFARAATGPQADGTYPVNLYSHDGSSWS